MEFEGNGMGRAEADKIALFSLEANDVVPIDTHMHQIFHRKTGKNVNIGTQKGYDEVSDYFTDLLGP